MIIDCEVHVFPRQFDYQRCRVEHLLHDMDEAGVDKAFLTFYCDSILTSPCGEITEPNVRRCGDSNEQTWEYFRDAYQKNKDRFYFFSVPDPREPDCLGILQRHCDAGMIGIGETQPATQNILPDGPEFMRVYKFAADRGLPVVLTMERWEYTNCFFAAEFNDYLAMFERVIREFRGTRFMISHAGDCGTVLGKNWDAYLASNRRLYELAAEVDNLWICSCMPWWFARGNVNPLLEQQLKFFRQHLGFEKVTWASDWPYNGSGLDYSFGTKYAWVVDYYRQFPHCSETERAWLLGKAAEKFVKG